jgi:MoxR-like ATPase
MDERELERGLKAIQESYEAYLRSLTARIKGCETILERLFIAFLCGGNVLLEGAPGLGKTSLAKAWAEFFGLSFNRVQFTPDLMPLDIIGSNLLEDGPEGRRFKFYRGPIFANLILGDEINRATPKTQSAFLEAMEEGRVSFLGTVYELPKPFIVIATQNPIELEGTYPLPEAQLDRFFMKLDFRMPDFHSLMGIMELAEREAAAPERCAIEPALLLASWKELSAVLPAPDGLKPYIARIIQETHPDRSASPLVKRYCRYGASPRSAIALAAAARARAVINGRANPSYDDVDELLAELCAHRIILNFDAEADGVGVEQLLGDIKGRVRREFSLRAEAPRP